MKPFKLTPAANAALREYNLTTVGRGIKGSSWITAPDVLERLEMLAMPHEDGNAVILRIMRQGGGTVQ